MSELSEKLLRCDAVRSLQSEARLAHALVTCDWQTTHGWYYTDVVTRKVRELDILAYQRWDAPGSDDKHVFLHFAVEVKSVSGYHVVFAQPQQGNSSRPSNNSWLGSEGEIRDRVRQMLTETLPHATTANSILQEFASLAYPEDRAAPWQLIVQPPPAEVQASAFRETNTDKEKDLDTSVFWRAGLALHSAVQALNEEFLAARLSDLHDAIEDSQAHENAEQVVAWGIRRAVNRAQLVHPLVVIDAPLWVYRDGSVDPIQWCRFIREGRYGGTEWWFDIVNSEFAEKLIDQFNDYYTREYSNRGAKRHLFTRIKASSQTKSP